VQGEVCSPQGRIHERIERTTGRRAYADGPCGPRSTVRLLTRRARDELGALQASVDELAAIRNAALRMFTASRSATTEVAQREFWLEFSWLHQEYRAAVRRLAQFCLQHRDNTTKGVEQ
jgi:hypothetical protein